MSWHDIMPTILGLAGLPIPDSVDGENLADLLHGNETMSDSLRKYIHGECIHLNYMRYGGYETQQHEGKNICQLLMTDQHSSRTQMTIKTTSGSKTHSPWFGLPTDHVETVTVVYNGL